MEFNFLTNAPGNIEVMTYNLLLLYFYWDIGKFILTSVFPMLKNWYRNKFTKSI